MITAGTCKVPAHGAGKRVCIRFEQEPVAVEAIALPGGIRPIDPSGVEGTRADAVYPQMPDITGTVETGIQRQCSRWFMILKTAKQQQADSGGMATEYCEVDARFVQMSTEWRGHTCTHLWRYTATLASRHRSMSRFVPGIHCRFRLQPVIQRHIALEGTLFGQDISRLGDLLMPLFRRNRLYLLTLC